MKHIMNPSSSVFRVAAIVLLLLSGLYPAEAQEFSFPPDKFDKITHGDAIRNGTLMAGVTPNANGYGDPLPRTEHSMYSSDMQANPSNWSTRYTFPVLHDFVRIGINHETVPPPTTAYKYRFSFWINRYDNPATPNTVSGSTYATLDLEYDPASGTPYKDQSVYKFSNCHSFSVVLDKVETINANNTTTLIPRSSLAGNFFIKTEVAAQRYDLQVAPHFLCKAVPNAAGSLLEVDWGYFANNPNGSGCRLYNGTPVKPPRPVLYELEWTYIDDYNYDVATKTLSYAFTGGGNVDYSFRNSATRVRTYNSSYKIPLAYEHGLILYRIRTLRPDAAFGKLEVLTDWTLGQSGVVSLSGACLPAYGYLVNQAFQGDKFNWQYSVSFAEDAKYKHSVNYFDGVGKNRQNLTWLNSQYAGGASDYVVAQENIYDREGRPSIKTLPVPVMTGSLNYIPNLTTVNGGQQLKASHFDLPAAICSPVAIPALDAASLANKYYSPSNPDQGGMQKYVPNANGYPYVQTIYSPDNTDKIRWQGGAGDTHQPWNGHATQFDHVRADQIQLNKIFGTEAGKAEFYPKEIITDQNGQTTFSIYDPDGKVMVTGLSGYEPSLGNTSLAIDKLSSRPANPTFVAKELLKDVKPMLLGNRINQSSTFYTDVSAPTGASVSHSASLKGFGLCNKYLTPQLKYTVKIIDNCGAPEYNYQGTVGTWNVTASGAAQPMPATLVNNMPLPNLDRGKYIVESAVHLDRDALHGQVASFFDTEKGAKIDNACFTDERQFIYDEVMASTYPCTSPANEPSSDCESLKKELMKELWPGAKYGLYTPSTIMVAHPNSIFGYLVWGQPELRYQASCVTLSNPIVINGTTYTSLANISGQVLIDNFNDQIAEALLPLHPEYCKLLACDNYSAEIDAISSYAQAQSLGRHTLAGLLAGDPKNPTTNPSSTFTLDELRQVTASNGTAVLLDEIAIRLFYCGSGAGSAADHCSQHLYANEIQNRIVPSDPAKADEYWQRLKAIYIGNRNYQMYKKMGQAFTTCNPCGGVRVEPWPNSEQVFVNVLDANTIDQYIDPNEIPADLSDLVNTFNNPAQATSMPASSQASRLQVHQQRCDRLIEDMLDQLKGCGIVPTSAQETTFKNQIKTALSYTNPDVEAELVPSQVMAALTAAGVSNLNDLCHPFLVDYATANNYAAKASARSFVCKDNGFYDGFKNFLNRSQVWAALSGAGANTSITLSSTNSFESALVTAIAGNTSNMTVSMTVGTDAVTQTSGTVNVRKLTFTISGGTPVTLYFGQSGFPSNLQVDAVKCLNGDAAAYFSSQVAQNTVSFDLNSGSYTKISCWSNRMPFMETAQTMNADNTLTCVDALNGLNNFKTEAPTYKYDVQANHPLYRSSLANYLNFKYKRNFTGDEYESLMHGCAVSDKTTVRAHKATMKVVTSSVVAPGFYNALNGMVDQHLDFHSYNQGGTWTFFIDLNSVATKDLASVRSQIITAAAGGTVTYLPTSPAVTNDVLILADAAVSSFTWNSTTYTPQSVTYGDPAAAVNKKLFTVPVSVASTLATANDLASLNTAVAATMPGASMLSDFKLYRSNDYSLTQKQQYLTYVYGLPSNYTRDQVVLQVAPASLVSLYTGKTVGYEEPFCADKHTDLYIQDNAISSSRLNYIVQQVNSYTGNRPFNFTNPFTTVIPGSSTPTNELAVIKNSDGSFWYRYFDQYRNLYNLYVKPPEKAYNLSQCTFTACSILPSYDGSTRAIRFAVTGSNGVLYECEAYATGLSLAEQKLQNVVLYTPPYTNECLFADNCEKQQLQSDIQDGLMAFDQYRTEIINKQTGLYLNHLVAQVSSTLQVTVPDMSYHFTLYYYDQAGNLIRTVSPQGQQPLTASTATIDQQRLAVDVSSTYIAQSNKYTSYKYNSRNQVIWQQTPDGGQTYFFYDVQGRLVFSQDSRQRPLGRYSYTLYDDLSRVEETGEVRLDKSPAPTPADPTEFTLNSTTYMYNGVSGNFLFNPYVQNVQDWSMNQIRSIVHPAVRFDVVRTLYDEPVAPTSTQAAGMWQGNGQDNLRNRVSSLQYYEAMTSPSWTPYSYATHFSYDAVGNVKTLIQDYPTLEKMNKRFIRVDYDYDLASGKINALSYNRGYTDQFYHRYSYDADNRLTEVQTSNDGTIWDKDASYEYYKHGPLATTKLGDVRVQSLEYAYTIKGWLKTINGQLLRTDNDMGQNGIAPTSAYPKDVMAHSLDYFGGDYSPIGAGALPNQPLPLTPPGKNLYNGNIVRQSTGIYQASAQVQDLVRNYQYDQLQRLVAATNANVQVSGGGSSASYSLVPTQSYASEYSYDADGNIKTLQRRDGSAAWIDQLTYNYTSSLRNTLGSVSDATSATASTVDIDNQANGNYKYDGAGNLIKDQAEELDIAWNSFGKAKSIYNYGDSWTMSFQYDGMGNRFLKDNVTGIGSTQYHNGEYYVRDAQGNILATYRLSSEWNARALFHEFIGNLVPISGGGRLLADAGMEYQPVAGSLRSVVLQNDRASWVLDRAAEQPVSLVLANSQDAYDRFIGGAGWQLDSLLYSEMMDTMLIRALAESIHESNVDFLTQLMWDDHGARKTLRYLCEINPEYLAVMLKKLGLGPQHPGDCVNEAEYVRNAYLERDLADLFAETLLQTLQNDRDATIAFYEMLVGDTSLVRFGEIEAQMLELLYSEDPGHKAMLMKLFDDWGDARTVLNQSVPAAVQGDALFVYDPVGLSERMFADFGTLMLEDALVSSGVPPGDFQGTVVAKTILGGQTTLQTAAEEQLVSAPAKERIELAEHHLYGSARLGIKTYPTGTTALFNDWNVDRNVPVSTMLSTAQPWLWHGLSHYLGGGGNGTLQQYAMSNSFNSAFTVRRDFGRKQYELTDHLGNVMVTILDRKTYLSGAGWSADIASAQDYYPFGMLMPGRDYVIAGGSDFRFGFNGQQKDNEIRGTGNSLDFKFRGYDSRLARFTSIDPLTDKFPWWTPYQFAGNTPIQAIDLDGAGPLLPLGNVIQDFLHWLTKPRDREITREEALMHDKSWEGQPLDKTGWITEPSQYDWHKNPFSAVFKNIGYLGASIAGWDFADNYLATVGEMDPIEATVQTAQLGLIFSKAKSESVGFARPPKTNFGIKIQLKSASSITPRKVGNLAGGPLESATQVSGRFKLEGGPANGTQYRADNQGNITSYATYDANGMIIKRVDVTGAAHNGVPTPHVLEYGRNTLPNGQVRVQSAGIGDPRPATPSEIP